MHKENFTERDIPYELLEKHGLSQAMIDDLPQSVMNKLLHGEYTPMLPLNFKTEAGDYQLMSRIALTRTANQDVRVILKPKIDTSSLGLYTQEQQELLKAGKTIIGMDPDDLRNGENNGKCFIQYDDESNQVLSVPTYAIGENIRTLTDVLGLDYDSIKNLQSGDPQTTEWASVLLQATFKSILTKTRTSRRSITLASMGFGLRARTANQEHMSLRMIILKKSKSK